MNANDIKSSTKMSTWKTVRRTKMDKIYLTILEWTNEIKESPLYHPSEQEFEDPLVYLQKIAPEASEYGICKIVSSIKASIPVAVVLKYFKFKTLVQPLRLSKWNKRDNIVHKCGREYTYPEFGAVADKAFLTQFDSSEDIPSSSYVEKKFWNEMAHGKKGTVKYGVNVEGSAFSCDPDDKLGKSKWNLKNFPRLPKSILRFIEEPIPGVTDPMLYIGMLYSMFAWHIEDMYIYSINYLHSGACKTWYCVPDHAASDFENAVLNHVYCKDILLEHSVDGAFEIVAKKTTMFPPELLLKQRVPVYKAVQKPGEFVITFPRAYHAGFSHGFNCGEAVNFAVIDWFQHGKKATEVYAYLKMPLIINYEELLYKEAMDIYNSLKDKASDYSTNDLATFKKALNIYKSAVNKKKIEDSMEFNAENRNMMVKKHNRKRGLPTLMKDKRARMMQNPRTLDPASVGVAGFI